MDLGFLIRAGLKPFGQGSKEVNDSRVGINELESMLDAVDPQSANKGATGSSRRKFDLNKDLNKDGFSLKSISKEKITLFGQEKLFGMSGWNVWYWK